MKLKTDIQVHFGCDVSAEAAICSQGAVATHGQGVQRKEGLSSNTCSSFRAKLINCQGWAAHSGVGGLLSHFNLNTAVSFAKASNFFVPPLIPFNFFLKDIIYYRKI